MLKGDIRERKLLISFFVVLKGIFLFLTLKLSGKARFLRELFVFFFFLGLFYFFTEPNISRYFKSTEAYFPMQTCHCCQNDGKESRMIAVVILQVIADLINLAIFPLGGLYLCPLT